MAEAQLGCSGEVQGQVGFVVAFPIPAPFCLKQAQQHSWCPAPHLCVLLGVPVSCSVSQSRDKHHLPDPARALMHHFYKHHPGPMIRPLGLFVLALSFSCVQSNPCLLSPVAKPALPLPCRLSPSPGVLRGRGQDPVAGLGLSPHFIVLRVWAASVPQPMWIGAGAGPELSLFRSGPPSQPEPGRARLASRSLPKPDFIVIVHTLMFSLQPWNLSLYFSTLLFPGNGCCLPLPRHNF